MQILKSLLIGCAALGLGANKLAAKPPLSDELDLPLLREQDKFHRGTRPEARSTQLTGLQYRTVRAEAHRAASAGNDAPAAGLSPIAQKRFDNALKPEVETLPPSDGRARRYTPSARTIGADLSLDVTVARMQLDALVRDDVRKRAALATPAPLDLASLVRSYGCEYVPHRSMALVPRASLRDAEALRRAAPALPPLVPIYETTVIPAGRFSVALEATDDAAQAQAFTRLEAGRRRTA